ncbi:MAG: hypothetical protein SGPRY_005243 [Prymnesium sp.]
MNEANRQDWDAPLRTYVEDIQAGKGESGKPYTLRYVGSMVGDVHRTLIYGGLFGYPADLKNKNGKLRLLYEASPMAYLIEQVLECRNYYNAFTSSDSSSEEAIAIRERCFTRLTPGQLVDTNMDNIPDSIAVDSNGDGKVDKVVKLPNDLDMGNL